MIAPTERAPRCTTPLALAFATATDRGLQRARNEDEVGILQRRRLVVVADGLGGQVHGDVASQVAVATLRELFEAHATRGTGGAERSRLVSAMTVANGRILAESLRLTGRPEAMGTTLVAAVFSADGRRLTMAHVGDSRCYRVRGGRAVSLTRDHSLAVELGSASVDEAEGSLRNVLTRVLGTGGPVRAEVRSEATRSGDVYVLCTDGLWTCVSEAEIAETVLLARSLEAACVELVASANARGGPDNITVALVRVGP